MSNYAALRDRILAAHDRGSVSQVDAQQDFDVAWGFIGGREELIEGEYVRRLNLRHTANAPVPQPPLPAPAVILPALHLDHAALLVIVDALSGTSLFEPAARIQVRNELIAEMRKLGFAIGVKA